MWLLHACPYRVHDDRNNLPRGVNGRSGQSMIHHTHENYDNFFSIIMPNNELWPSQDYNEFSILQNQPFDNGNPSSSPEIQIQNDDYGSQSTYLTSLTPDDGHGGPLTNGELSGSGEPIGHSADTVIQYNHTQYQPIQENWMQTSVINQPMSTQW